MTRSFLFVPADSERKMRSAETSGADALIFDLEDSVAEDARPAARQLAAEQMLGRANIWVRINPLNTQDAQLDLAAVMPSAPAGIVLPKPESATETIELARRLDELESKNGLDVGRTKILPLCTERPRALFSLGGYVGATERLAGLTWGAEDLSAALGASENRDSSGAWLPPYELARSLCLMAAAAAGVAAFDTVFTDFRDLEGVARYAANARRDGFAGMLAIHPGQVEIINQAFVPTEAELSYARRIVELFAANPGAGTLALDGNMLDRPHLLQAERLIALAESLKGG